MLEMVEEKIRKIRRKAEREMMERTVEGDEASGRYAACETLLSGIKPEDALNALCIIPQTLPQRRGAKEIFEQFEGLI